MSIRMESSPGNGVPQFKILCDFDGTAAADDVGNALSNASQGTRVLTSSGCGRMA